MECWSTGMMRLTMAEQPMTIAPLLHYSITPVLQYSSTPVLQYSTPSLQHSIIPPLRLRSVTDYWSFATSIGSTNN
jgi:hypothetical protein